MDGQFLKTQTGVTHAGTIKVAPGDIDKFLEAFRLCWQHVCKETDCIFFEVLHSKTDPGVFHFVEVWDKDNDWFMNVQIKKDYYIPYWEATKPMWLSRDMGVFDRLAGWSLVDKKYLEGAVQDKAGIL